MAGKDRTVLMGEGADTSEKKKRKPFRTYLRIRAGGVGGTIGSVKSKSGHRTKFKWRAGAIKSTPGAKRGRSGAGKLSRKALGGFKFEVKF